MPKKPEHKIIRPSDAVRSLEELNNRVLLLVQNCKQLLKNDLVDSRFANTLQDSVDKVDEFYKD